MGKVIHKTKIKVYTLINRLLNSLGYQLISKNTSIQLQKYVFNLLESVKDDNNEIASVVFSKDRAMQLHAFLSSYIKMVNNRKKMYILYKATTERHKKSYEQIKDIFSDKNFFFVEETEFKNQLIEICESADVGKIIFYVDDMIFTHSVDYAEYEEINTNKFVLALSRGKDLDYSMVLNKPLKLPAFSNEGNSLLSFSWNNSNEWSDWTFPLGVSGYMFGKKEIVSILKSISFKAPNSLECSMQIFRPYFMNRYGLCTEFAACACVHANLVQVETKNPTLETYSIDELLKLWEEGERINLSDFYGKPVMVAQTLKYSFISSAITDSVV